MWASRWVIRLRHSATKNHLTNAEADVSQSGDEEEDNR
jgi:hypothetical protein